MENNTTTFLSSLAFIIVFLIIVECAKVPEYRCKCCNKVYKQEARYNAHIAGCIVGNTIPVSADDFSELLRQNREMMMMLRSQQETIQLLVNRLTEVPKMNIE